MTVFKTVPAAHANIQGVFKLAWGWRLPAEALAKAGAATGMVFDA